MLNGGLSNSPPVPPLNHRRIPHGRRTEFVVRSKHTSSPEQIPTNQKRVLPCFFPSNYVVPTKRDGQPERKAENPTTQWRLAEHRLCTCYLKYYVAKKTMGKSAGNARRFSRIFLKRISSSDSECRSYSLEIPIRIPNCRCWDLVDCMPRMIGITRSKKIPFRSIGKANISTYLHT